MNEKMKKKKWKKRKKRKDSFQPVKPFNKIIQRLGAGDLPFRTAMPCLLQAKFVRFGRF